MPNLILEITEGVHWKSLKETWVCVESAGKWKPAVMENQEGRLIM